MIYYLNAQKNNVIILVLIKISIAFNTKFRILDEASSPKEGAFIYYDLTHPLLLANKHNATSWFDHLRAFRCLFPWQNFILTYCPFPFLTDKEASQSGTVKLHSLADFFRYADKSSPSFSHHKRARCIYGELFSLLEYLEHELRRNKPQDLLKTEIRTFFRDYEDMTFLSSSSCSKIVENLLNPKNPISLKGIQGDLHVIKNVLINPKE